MTPMCFESSNYLLGVRPSSPCCHDQAMQTVSQGYEVVAFQELSAQSNKQPLSCEPKSNGAAQHPWPKMGKTGRKQIENQANFQN